MSSRDLVSLPVVGPVDPSPDRVDLVLIVDDRERVPDLLHVRQHRQLVRPEIILKTLLADRP